MDYPNSLFSPDIDLNLYPFVKNPNARSDYFVNIYLNDDKKTRINTIVKNNAFDSRYIARHITEQIFPNIQRGLVMTAVLEVHRYLQTIL
jgi:hypothetical protein